MKDYPNEEFTKKIVDAIEIFNDHALISYRNILTYWFDKDDRIKISTLISIQKMLKSGIYLRK